MQNTDRLELEGDGRLGPFIEASLHSHWDDTWRGCLKFKGLDGAQYELSVWPGRRTLLKKGQIHSTKISALRILQLLAAATITPDRSFRSLHRETLFEGTWRHIDVKARESEGLKKLKNSVDQEISALRKEILGDKREAGHWKIIDADGWGYNFQLPVTPESEGSTGAQSNEDTLAAIRAVGSLHHYHATTRHKERFWYYAIWKFDPDEKGPILRTTEYFHFDDGFGTSYALKAEFIGDTFIVIEEAKPGKPVTHIGMFPEFAKSYRFGQPADRIRTSKLDCHGLTFYENWDGGRAFGPILISSAPIRHSLRELREGRVPERIVVDGEEVAAAELLDQVWAEMMGATPINSTWTSFADPATAFRGFLQDTPFIEEEWDERKRKSFMKRAPKDTNIRIFVSYFIDLGIFADIRNLLIEDGSKRTIEVMLLDPDVPHLLETRYGTENSRFRDDGIVAAEARAHIVEQIGKLKGVDQEVKAKAVQSHDATVGSLRVYLYNLAPTLISYQRGDEALVGMLFIHASANEGPMIEITKKHNMKLWNAIKDNWNTALQKRCRQVVGDPVDRASAIWV